MVAARATTLQHGKEYTLDNKELAGKFFALFSGLDRAYGVYKIKKRRSAKGKIEGSASTVRAEPTAELWEQHLLGKNGVGIIPIMDDGNCRFGVIDIDVYDDLDLPKLEEEIRALKLPLILCASKSGGAHLFLFLSELVPAELVRSKLMNWAVSLGHSGVEVFPKQTRLANANDIGNWINMPYYGKERWAIHGGKSLNPEDFLSAVAEYAVDEKTLKATDPPEDETVKTLLLEAPPCLQCLARTGFPTGSRNMGLFNLGVYLRKRYGDDFGDHFDDFNQQFMDPPLGHKEVAQCLKGVARKTYEYRCNEQPLVQNCTKQICLTREFGIGTGENEPGVIFGKIYKVNTEPPMWIWDVDGARIELTTSELKDQQRFHMRCMEELNKWPLLMKPKTWSMLIRDRLSDVEIIEAPPDASQYGMVQEHLHAYCSARVKAHDKEELLLGKPWKNGERIYFTGLDFKRYLDQQRMRVSEKQLWNYLRRIGAASKGFKIKGRFIRTWHIPITDVEQTESFTVPDADGTEAM